MKVVKRIFGRILSCVLVLMTFFSSIALAAEQSKMPKGWSDGFLYSNGIRIHYYHTNKTTGKPVILAIHGVMDTGLSWASVGTILQKDYDLYMLDTRGHGLSDPFNGLEDRNSLLLDVLGAAKSLGLVKPVLMGHSMGGATVIRLGAEYPDFARAIIVVDAGIGGPRPQNKPKSVNPPSKPTVKPDTLPISMSGSPEVMVKQNNYGFEALVAKAHWDNPRWSMMDCHYWAIAIKRYHGPYSNEVWQTMFNTMRNENALAKIQIPMIILKADAPQEVRKAQLEEASVMQKGKLVHIDNSGHNLQRDQPLKAASVIKEFLQELH